MSVSALRKPLPQAYPFMLSTVLVIYRVLRQSTLPGKRERVLSRGDGEFPANSVVPAVRGCT
jgi:hypothetical protein